MRPSGPASSRMILLIGKKRSLALSCPSFIQGLLQVSKCFLLFRFILLQKRFKDLKRAWNIDSLKDKARGALAINR